MDKIIILLCGIPGAGKSTIARLLENQYNLTNQSVLIISFDDFQDSPGTVTPLYNSSYILSIIT